MRKWSSLVVVALLVLAITSCAPKEQEPYKIGAAFAVTGPAAWLGEPEKNTVKMIEEQINAKGGINGHPLQIIVEDTVGAEDKTVNAIKKLITKDNVLAIVGPSRSGTTMAAIPIAEEYKVPMVSCAAAEAIINPVKKWVFKTPQNDSDAVRKIYAKLKEMNIDKIAVMSGTTGFGKAGRDQLKKIAAEQGLTIVADETYGPGDTDMTAQLTKIKGTDAQAIINWSIVPAQTTVIKNRSQLGISIPLFQSHGFGNINYARAAGEAANGVLFPCGRLLAVETLADDNPQKALLKKYTDDYTAKFQSDISTFGGHALDAINLVVEALEAVGPDRAKIRDHIESRTNFVGTGGIFNYSETDHVGLDITAFEMITVKDGKFVVAQ